MNATPDYDHFVNIDTDNYIESYDDLNCPVYYRGYQYNYGDFDNFDNFDNFDKFDKFDDNKSIYTRFYSDPINALRIFGWTVVAFTYYFTNF